MLLVQTQSDGPGWQIQALKKKKKWKELTEVMKQHDKEGGKGKFKSCVLNYIC